LGSGKNFPIVPPCSQRGIALSMVNPFHLHILGKGVSKNGYRKWKSVALLLVVEFNVLKIKPLMRHSDLEALALQMHNAVLVLRYQESHLWKLILLSQGQ